MRRREFITLVGGAAAGWPLAARAQQPGPMPVIGFLNLGWPEASADQPRAFRRGLLESGYVEGESVAIEYRWAENQIDRLPVLAADLVRRKVAVIAVSGGLGPALVTKAATTTIPVVFLAGDDPVRLGLVASLARPGGNLTGVNFFASELVAKQLELLRELVPAATRVALLANPANATVTESTLRDVQPAARAMGLLTEVFNADNSREINAAFASFMRDRPDALFVGPGPFFVGRRVQLTQLAALHRMPAIYPVRQFVEAGGLSYGASLMEAFRQIGVYTGRVLKGTKPSDLPVAQSTKFELVINAQTSLMLGLEVPATLLARADEVIE